MIKAMQNAALLLALTMASLASAQEGGAPRTADPKSDCPMHASHMAATKTEPVRADGSAEHGHEVDGRHDTFGMSHAKSTHSFRLFEDGGAIELRANDPADSETIVAIRKHLQDITPQFTKGDFSTPRFVHGYAPDGVAQLARLGNEITYHYQPLDGGARIRITTASGEALAAIHAFLRFQVTEHRTANSGNVEVDDLRQ